MIPQTCQPFSSTTLGETHIKGRLQHIFVPSLICRHFRTELRLRPKNSLLVGSVISAATMKQELCDSAAQVGAVARVIQFPGAECQQYCDPEAWEASLGACV